jgi:PEP-CTERM motif
MKAKLSRPAGGRLAFKASAVAAALAGLSWASGASAVPLFDWKTVVNNGDLAPDSAGGETFFSYNQPSINDTGLVVFRARARVPSGSGNGGAGEPLRGIWTRDMGVNNSPINTVASNKPAFDVVPQPNNLSATFNEFPSFPRIDAKSSAVAFRGQSTPVWEYVTGVDPNTNEPITTRVGTSGVYTTPTGGALVTGASGLGAVPAFPYFAVPLATTPGTKFDQFPGAPTVTGNTVAFKGNWTDSVNGSQTGIYYREVGGTAPVQHIASRGMQIPGAANGIIFDSTSPPSAASGKVVFLGLDNEEAPTAGGIFVAPLAPSPALTPLVTLGAGGTLVPGAGTTFKTLGEGLSFDGKYVAFAGGWGNEFRKVNVSCPTDGNAALKAACIAQDNNGVAGDGNYEFSVLKHQGIFTVNAVTGEVTMKAQTGENDFLDFTFWNFSGAPPDSGGGDEGGDDREPPRWRSSSFAAVSNGDVVFKGLTNTATGLYGNVGGSVITILDTTMDGGVVDVDAAGLPIVSLGIERDGFRNGRLAINASMANDDAGWAGVYVTSVPEPSTYALMALGLAAVGFSARRRRSNA